ncbi:MAG TPA: CsbD family protein [Conexibacter sp.]|nr:CsbD family protein [Conexibacter sp.]
MAGRTQKAKGRVKESAGVLANDKKMKDRGRVDQAAGSVKKHAGKAADKAGDAANDVRKKLD